MLYVEDIEDDVGASPVALTDYPDDGGQYRFCTEALVEGSDLPAESVVRDALREDSEELIVIR
ncbi:MAG: hypothetical protein GWN39_20150, partial [Thermoplasmata archaeon]|nr:hypothetical protein [Thermoplasmata archaeon]NIW91131.1 hypothetical protein [Thermoplasmata archaeon]